jgi:hypothetical protein
MRRLVPTLGLFAILALIDTSARGAECPDFPPFFEFEDCGVCELDRLPSADCNVDTTCCASGALDLDVEKAGGSGCDEVIAFAAVANNCPGDWSGHIGVFNMDEVSWEDNGLETCDTQMPFGRHWVAATYLAAAIDNDGPIHHRGPQYLMAAQSTVTDFHPLLEHRLSPGLEKYAAQYIEDHAIADTIRFGCGSFRVGGSAETLAGTFVHEAWHSVYGDHDIDPVFGENDETITESLDHYYAHDFYPKVPKVSESFDPDAWTTEDKPGEVIHSVYQIQHEFLCDIVRSPRNWVPRAGLFEAVEKANSILQDNIINSVAVPVTEMCSDASIRMRVPRDPALPDDARVLDIDVDGTFVETSEDSQDDDSGEISESFQVIVVPGGGPVVLDETIGPFADGEVWLEIDLQAELAADGDTVAFSYNLLFYEADEDDTHCDEDLVGDDCPARFDPSQWIPASVDSLGTVYFDNEVLDNASNENGTDYADITMNVELSW